MINPIPYTKTASGYHGVIAGRHHAVTDPQELLDRAKNAHPRLVFKLERV